MNVPDNYDLWEAHDRQRAERAAKQPVCEICGDPIWDEHLFLINDEFVCVECLVRDFRRDTDDFIG